MDRGVNERIFARFNKLCMYVLRLPAYRGNDPDRLTHPGWLDVAHQSIGNEFSAKSIEKSKVENGSCVE